MNCKFELDDKATTESLRILKGQFYKILPLYEGKDLFTKEIKYTREEAYANYLKHLTFLTTKVSGASKIWIDNQYYVELLYLLMGMPDFTIDEHDRVRYIVLHCTSLIGNMEKKVLSNA